MPSLDENVERIYNDPSHDLYGRTAIAGIMAPSKVTLGTPWGLLRACRVHDMRNLERFNSALAVVRHYATPAILEALKLSE